MVLALNERGGLAHVLLFWGALGRQKEGLIKLVSSLFSLFISSQKVGGQEKNLDKLNLRATIKPAGLGLGALVSSWLMGSTDNSTRAVCSWEPWRHVSVRV